MPTNDPITLVSGDQAAAADKTSQAFLKEILLNLKRLAVALGADPEADPE